MRIAHLKENSWGVVVFFSTSVSRFHTGFIRLQRKNLCAESCWGWRQSWHLGESKMCILCSFWFVRQVFLSTRNCRSLASMSLLVRASLIICFCNRGGEFCVEESFVKFDHAVSSNASLLISFENSLQPLMLGEVSCRSGCTRGP